MPQKTMTAPDVSKMTLRDLDDVATGIRADVIRMLEAAGSGHVAGSLGMADVFTALYFGIARITPKMRAHAARDRIVLSNAHICPVLYATLAARGYIDRKELLTIRKLGSRLQGHSNNHYQPDLPIETCGGPLGQGLSQAVGFALASRMNGRANANRSKQLATWHTWCLISDGELNEGQMWEAILLAGKTRLGGMTVFLDRNKIQIDGSTEDVLPLEPLTDKFRAFNWNVIDVDGHNIREIIAASKKARAVADKPTLINCHTIPGKGVPFMENRCEWHGKAPSHAEALEAIRSLDGRISHE
jgi:transketolase